MAATATVVAAVTAVVVATAFALVAPEGMLMVVGVRTRFGLELPNSTTAPPTGAGALKLTVIETGDPPVTLVGLRTMLASCGMVVVVLVVLSAAVPV